MNAEAPFEFLKAHTITSRSWLAAMLERKKEFKNNDLSGQRSMVTENEIIKWCDREDHEDFDVCADDHCQRYQGIIKDVSRSAEQAVTATRGTFLVYDGRICDARFSKACGGRTELFGTCWEDTDLPYLRSISDAVQTHTPVTNESEAERWILGSPEAYCNTADGNILRQILPSYDRETADFFRWKVEYSPDQLEQILKVKSGLEFGTVTDIVPLQRGGSGRIYKLKIVGSKRTLIVGKELEIRRWLSKTHLYSSAFVVKIERDASGTPVQFAFHGSGWGHGVGLCQIGAAVMAVKGITAENIVAHYFKGAELKKLY
jgi:stage II sporulation protein D